MDSTNESNVKSGLSEKRDKKKKDFLCQYLISDIAKNKITVQKTNQNDTTKFDGKYESFYFPTTFQVNNATTSNPKLNIDSWPAHAESRARATNQIYITSDGHLIHQTAEKCKLPPVKKPRFLEMLEARISKEKVKFHVKDGEPDPLRLQIYREVFTIFIQTCVYYGPLLAKIKAEYESYLVHMQNELKKLQPIKELLWTVSQECENRVSNMRRRENKDIKTLNLEKKSLRSQISLLQEDANSLTCEVKKLTQELEKKADEWRTESDGRKLLITEVNELTSRLKEMETLARAEVMDEQEDPTKLRIALDQAHKMINNLQTRVTQFETDYESQVPRTKYEEVKKHLTSQIEETTHLKEELDSLQSRYDLLQDHCVTLNTYRDLYYIQVTYSARVLGAKGDPTQKVEFVSSLLSKWRRLLADKPWMELQRIVGDEMLRLESGQTPIMVRASRAVRHRGTIFSANANDLPNTPSVRESMFKPEAA